LTPRDHKRGERANSEFGITGGILSTKKRVKECWGGGREKGQAWKSERQGKRDKATD